MKFPLLKNAAIKAFVKHYGVNMEEAENSDPRSYENFNAFFTRPLKQGARTIDKDNDAFISPVDGAISQIGQLNNQSIIQAKGHDYSLTDLLAHDAYYIENFTNGHFTTIYLSPKDYHRIHMPFSGKLRRMTHVPGRLFSVNPTTVNNIPNLFAINERVIAYFDCEFGPMAVIFVGATIVGSIATQWSGIVTPPSASCVNHWDYDDSNITFEKGDEIGRFLLGSTVILLTPENSTLWDNTQQPEKAVVLGEKMGVIQQPSHS